MNWLTRRRVATLLAFAFVLGIVAFLPAYLFEDRLNDTLPAPWHLSMSGTIWNGFGVLQAGPAGDAVAVPLTWTFDPPSLARLRLAWTVVPSSAALAGSVKIGAGWQSLEFRNAALTIDAAAMRPAVPIAALYAPSGTLLLTTPDDARLTAGYGNALRLKGTVHFNVDNFGLGSVSPQPLGNYQLRITARDTAIDYVIARSSGALTLDGGGSIQITSPRQITYAGIVTASPALPDDLRSRLQSMGKPATDGRLRIDWQAAW